MVNEKKKFSAGPVPRKIIRLKRKRKSNINFLNSFQVPLSNKFNALSEDEDITDQVKPSPKLKVSPIVVTDHTFETQNFITHLGIVCDLKIISVGRKIFQSSIDDKKKISDALTEQNDHFFTYPDNYEKSFKAILSGLPALDTAIIRECLKTNHDIDVNKITMFNTKSENELYLCEFNSGDINLKVLNNIKTVHYHIISWQAYKPKRKGPTQCFRCLMYGHGASNCKRYAACIQCGGNHLTNTCTVITSVTTNPKFKCFNCASAKMPDAHKANDLACPFRAKYLATKEHAHNKGKRGTAAHNSNNINTDFVPAPAPPPLQQSFANITSNINNQQNHRLPTYSSQPNTSVLFDQAPSLNNNNHNATPGTNSELFSFNEVANIMVNCINDLKQCKTKLDQMLVIAKMLQNACN